MANKQLVLEAPEAVFDEAVLALWFNGGGVADANKLEAAKSKLRTWLRDEVAAYKKTQLNIKQRVEQEEFQTQLDAGLDGMAEVLLLNVIDVSE